MRRMTGWMTGLSAAAFPVVSLAHGVKVPAGVPQADCPVMSYPVNKEQFPGYRGKRVCFCCSACPEGSKKDPGNFMKEMKEQGGSRTGRALI